MGLFKLFWLLLQVTSSCISTRSLRVRESSRNVWGIASEMPVQRGNWKKSPHHLCWVCSTHMRTGVLLITPYNCNSLCHIPYNVWESRICLEYSELFQEREKWERAPSVLCSVFDCLRWLLKLYTAVHTEVQGLKTPINMCSNNLIRDFDVHQICFLKSQKSLSSTLEYELVDLIQGLMPESPTWLFCRTSEFMVRAPCLDQTRILWPTWDKQGHTLDLIFCTKFFALSLWGKVWICALNNLHVTFRHVQLNMYTKLTFIKVLVPSVFCKVNVCAFIVTYGQG